MPLYFGKSKDGSDMQEFEGMYVHPNGEEWSNTKYPESVYIAYDANHPKHKHEYTLNPDRGMRISDAGITYKSPVSLIDAVWNAVILYIKWYNTQKQKI